jgi:hypothetical protein
MREAKGEVVAFTDADCVAAGLAGLIAPFEDPEWEGGESVGQRTQGGLRVYRIFAVV